MQKISLTWFLLATCVLFFLKTYLQKINVKDILSSRYVNHRIDNSISLHFAAILQRNILEGNVKEQTNKQTNKANTS